MLITGAVAAAIVMPSAAFGEIDAKVRSLLETVADFYGSQSSVSGNSETAIAFKMGEMAQNLGIKTEMTAAAPNKVNLSARSKDMGNIDIVSNGVNIWAALDAPMISKGYVEGDAPATFEEMIEMEEMQFVAQGAESMFLILNMMSRETLDTFLEDVKSAEYLGEVEVDGVKNHHINVVTTQDPGMGMELEVPMAIWVRSGDEPSVTRVAPDMTAMLMGQPGTIDVTYNYTNWSFGDDLSADTFAYNAPEGFKKVDSFMDLMGGGMDEMPESLGAGEDAPDFELEKLDGGTFNLAAYEGKKIVVLDFWATWCGPCRVGLPTLVEVTDSMKEQGVVFYSVNLRETNEQVTEFLGKQDYTMNVLMDREGSVADEYGVSGIPHTVIIGLDGKIAEVKVGTASKEDFTKALESVVNGDAH